VDKDEIEKLLQELQEIKERYRSFTETSIDGLITSDGNDRILTWNRGAEEIFGHGPDIIGQSVTVIIPERYRQDHRAGVRRFLESGERRIIGKTVELEGVRKDGTEFPLELSLSSWKGPSGVFFGAIIRDISERRQMETLREDVQRMMRHDLRSPLIGMAGLTKVLLRGSNLTEKQRRSISLIHELGKKTLRFLDRSRDLMQMKQGVFELKPSPVNLVEILDRIRTELEPLSLKKGLELTIELEGRPVRGDEEYLVQGDENLIEMMFANLVKNAIEASPDGETLTVSIRGKEEEPQDSHLIDIHNLGAVPEEIRDTFFESYTTRGKQGGTGLGTHNALLVARAHGGDIGFTSSDEEGTHVTVRLPDLKGSDK
jgi:PAS domain S-box-containing protein